MMFEMFHVNVTRKEIACPDAQLHLLLRPLAQHQKAQDHLLGILPHLLNFFPVTYPGGDRNPRAKEHWRLCMELLTTVRVRSLQNHRLDQIHQDRGKTHCLHPRPDLQDSDRRMVMQGSAGIPPPAQGLCIHVLPPPLQMIRTFGHRLRGSKSAIAVPSALQLSLFPVLRKTDRDQRLVRVGMNRPQRKKWTLIFRSRLRESTSNHLRQRGTRPQSRQRPCLTLLMT